TGPERHKSRCAEAYLPQLDIIKKRGPLPFRKYNLQTLTLLLFCLAGSGIAQAKTYYLSPTGSDFNSGQSPSVPWLYPNHPLNCGDVIVAAASTTYSSAIFYTGKWGTVTCPAKNNVAWLQCATFDA